MSMTGSIRVTFNTGLEFLRGRIFPELTITVLQAEESPVTSISRRTFAPSFYQAMACEEEKEGDSEGGMSRGSARVLDSKSYEDEPPPPDCTKEAFKAQLIAKKAMKRPHSSCSANDGEGVAKRKQRRRKRVGYASNVAPSRSMPGRGQVSVVECREQIGYHASMRLQIFYPLALAYWKTERKIKEGRTLFQVGKGSGERGLSAAHSSVISNLTDTLFEEVKERIASEGVTPWVLSKLKEVGANEREVEQLCRLREKKAWPGVRQILASIEPLFQLIKKESHLYYLSNTTVELPWSVNKFDTILEEHLRKNHIHTLLNLVSAGALTPYAATVEFSRRIRDFLELSHIDTEESCRLARELEMHEKGLLDLEDAADLSNFKWISRYLRSMGEFMEVYERFSESREHTIRWNTSKLLHPRWNLILKLRELRKGKQGRGLARVEGMSKLERKGVVELIQREILDQERLPRFSDVLRELEEAATIIEYQWCHTRLPPYEQLSGRVVDGERVGHGEEELAVQREEMLRCE